MPQDLNNPDREVGFVVSAQDYLLYIEGLPSVRVNDIIVSGKGGKAIVSAFSEERIEALMLDPERPKPGYLFSPAKRGIVLPLGDKLVGRAITPLGTAIDGLGGLPMGTKELDLDIVSPGIDAREIIMEQLYTGISMVDTLVPIGKGQRELLFGEPRSGKSAFLINLIANQKGHNHVCIYTAIGKSGVEVKRLIQSITDAGAMDYTIVIAATSEQAAPPISITPAMAITVAEYFRDQGKSVILILDDLATHAKYLREIALLSGRIPGRESYPADIFYQHSHLVERAGNFNELFGRGSITLLPVIETDMENFTSLIPTNVMSMTDGHILFSSALRAQGQYPAIDVGKSVTRVGLQTQIMTHKILSDRVRSLLADYHELERYGRFGSELTGETQKLIKRGMIAEELLHQEALENVPPGIQILLLSLVFTPFFDYKDVEFVKSYRKKIIQTLATDPFYSSLQGKIPTTDLDKIISELGTSLKILEAACAT